MDPVTPEQVERARQAYIAADQRAAAERKMWYRLASQLLQQQLAEKGITPSKTIVTLKRNYVGTVARGVVSIFEHDATLRFHPYTAQNRPSRTARPIYCTIDKITPEGKK